MSKLILEIPEQVTEELRIPPDERLNRVRIELAIRLYQKSILSFGKARELAQLSKWEFHELLGQENIERQYDLEELETDLETLEILS
jgi:predicted HTH domain antitoxin